jgi:L-fuconolactonase
MMELHVMDCINRRDFLLASAATTAAALGPSPALSAAEGKGKAVIDTHTHFYDPTRPQGVPWPSKDDKLLYRRVLPEHGKAVARPHGVTGTVVVEASAWVEDNQWLLDLAKDEPFIVGIVGHLSPGDDRFGRHLERFAKNKLFRGLRIGAAELKKGLDQRRYVGDLERLADRDLALDVIGGPDMLAEVARLAGRLPGLRVVIDHVAGVPIDGKAVPRAWLAGMRVAAKYRNVFCKVSALAECTGRQDGKAPREVTFYKPVLDALWAVFGEDRLIYGSNWPVSERFASYAVVHGIVADYFGDKGQAATEKFFGRNALAAYKWVKR